MNFLRITGPSVLIAGLLFYMAATTRNEIHPLTSAGKKVEIPVRLYYYAPPPASDKNAITSNMDSFTPGYPPNITYAEKCGARSDADENGEVRSLNECMVRALIEQVTKNFAEFKPEMDIRFRVDSAEVVDYNALGVPVSFPPDPDKVLSALQDKANPKAGAINIYFYPYVSENNYVVGKTFVNSTLGSGATNKPPTILFVADAGLTGTAALLTHEIGHVMGSNDHLTEGFTYSGCGKEIVVKSFTQLKFKKSCKYNNYMGVFAPGDGHCNKAPKFGTPVHGPQYKDIFACWLHESNLSELPVGWPRSQGKQK